MTLQQHTHIWLPVNLGHSWALSSLDHHVVEFLNKILKRTNCMLDLVIAVIPNLIAVAANDSVTGIALHTSLQTKHFVGQQYKVYQELDSTSSNTCSTSDRD